MAVKYDPERIKKLQEETNAGVSSSPVVNAISDVYNRAKTIGDTVYNTPKAQEQLELERRAAETAAGVANSPVVNSFRNMFMGSGGAASTPQVSQQIQPPNNTPQNIQAGSQATKFDIQNSTEKPLTRLQQIARDDGTGSTKFLRAAHLGVYPEDETPNNLVKDNGGYVQVGEQYNDLSPKEQASLDLAKMMDRKSKQGFSNQQPSNPKSVQVVGNGNVTNHVFDGSGNRRVYDAQGNELSRADQEQMRLMGQVSRLIDMATPAYSISNPRPEADARGALQAIGGLKAAPTIADTQRDVAAARHSNVISDLAPGLANSEIGLRGAQAKHQMAAIPGIEADIGYKKAQTKSTLADIANKDLLAKAEDFSKRNPQLRGKTVDHEIEALNNDIKAANTGALTPGEMPERFGTIRKIREQAMKSMSPNNYQQAFDSYKRYYGDTYTDDQIHSFLKNKGIVRK